MKTITYKGYEYRPYEERDDDVIKIWHEIYKNGAPVQSADFTPYQFMSADDFMNYIDCGMPNRIGNGPLYPEDLENLLHSYIARGRE